MRKERVALHLDGAEDCKYDEDWAQADDGSQSAEKIEGAFKEAGVHVLNVTGSFDFAQDDGVMHGLLRFARNDVLCTHNDVLCS